MAEGARRPGASNESQESPVRGRPPDPAGRAASGERLEIGIVTHAKFIRETLAMLDKVPGAPITQARASAPEPVMPGADPEAAAAISAMAMGGLSH
ncbi:hypothetical protein ACRAWD_06035 [Caulobacter segnis]